VIKPAGEPENAVRFHSSRIFGAAIYALSYAFSWIWFGGCARAWHRVRAFFSRKNLPNREIAGNFWRWTLSGALFGVLVMAITYLIPE
jgi:hypothetical protein